MSNRSASERPYLSIGEVLGLLLEEFPESRHVEAAQRLKAEVEAVPSATPAPEPPPPPPAPTQPPAGS